MDIKFKKWLIQAFIVLSIFTIYTIYKEEKSLIMTPSTHEKIMYLDISDTKIAGRYKVKSVLYDEDCQYLQFCIVGRKRENLMQTFRGIRIMVDDEVCEEYSVTEKFSSFWWKDYFILWIKNISDYNAISIEFQGEIYHIYPKSD